MPITKEEIGRILQDATKAPLDRDAWIGQGFPESLVASFLATAEMTNTAVLTRVPGKATTQLIKETYDLKGFFIKSKSCDWGPMAGFLCRNPAFNKKGVNSIDYNIKYLIEYKSNLETKFQIGGTDEAFRKRAFVPLQISDDRKKQFLGAFSADPVYNFGAALGPVNSDVEIDSPSEQVYGIAAAADKSVVMEFLMNRINLNENGTNKIYWQLYHGYVYIRKAPAAPYEEYLAGQPIEPPKPADIEKSDKFQKTLKQDPDVLIFFSPKQKTDLTSWLQTKFGIVRGASDRCYTIDGAQNPHPPHTGAQSFKNAVTGDYDLFSVWPLLPKVGFDDLIRISEMGINDATRTSEHPNFDAMLPVSTRLLIPTAKQFTLELTRSRNIYIEFIPPGNILAGLESQFFGNITDAGFLVAQTLNSLNSPKVNAAFHSDEGGRPNVDEIEYPVAVFLPTVLLAKLKKETKQDVGPAILVEDHVQFLALIEALYQKCYISLNHGWLLHLFALIQEKSALEAQGDKKKGYYKKRVTERDQLAAAKSSSPSSDLAFITEMLETLFTRLAAYQESTRDMEATLQAYFEKLFLSSLDFEGLTETFWAMLINEDPAKTPEYWKKRLSREEVQPAGSP